MSQALLTRIAAGESEALEFKTTLADSRRIVETVAAMATLGGGTILVGVRDDGTVVGIDLGPGALEQLTQRVLAGTDPRVYPRLVVERVGDREVLRIDVPPGDGPHLAFGRAFVRSGPATVQLSRDAYERLLLDRLRESAGYERHVAPDESLDALDAGAIARFVELSRGRGVHWDGEPATLIDRLHLFRDGSPTIGALLLFGREPQRLLPQATVRLRVTRGAIESGASIEGSLIDQIDETVRQVRLHLRRRFDRSEVVRREVDELPAEAVREVIVNALVHRDYRSTAPVQVRLDETKLEVWNPGHLPAPLTIASLRRPHPSVPTNPRIARALHLAGYIEEWGTGTLRIASAMAAQHNPDPVFDEDLGGITVTLPVLGAEHAALSERQVDLLRRLRGESGSSSASELAQALGVSVRTAQQELSTLEALGLVARLGRGRALRWCSASTI